MSNVSFLLHKYTKNNINIFRICSVSQVNTCVPSHFFFSGVPEKVASYISVTFFVFSFKIGKFTFNTTMKMRKLKNQVLKSEILTVVLTTLLRI